MFGCVPEMMMGIYPRGQSAATAYGRPIHNPSTDESPDCSPGADPFRVQLAFAGTIGDRCRPVLGALMVPTLSLSIALGLAVPRVPGGRLLGMVGAIRRGAAFLGLCVLAVARGIRGGLSLRSQVDLRSSHAGHYTSMVQL